MRAELPTFIGILITALLFTGTARAEPASSDADELHPTQNHRFRLEAFAGGAFGRTKLETGESVNPYGAGFGFRVGYVFPFRLSLSVRADTFLGTSTTYQPRVAVIEYDTSMSSIELEPGFELGFGHALLRPSIGLGAAVLAKSSECQALLSSGSGGLSQQVCDATDEHVRNWSLSAAPGLTIGINVGRLYGFADVRYHLREVGGLGTFGGIGWML